MAPRRTPWLIGWEAAKANAAPAFVIGGSILCEVEQRFVNARAVFALGHVATG